jgi:hypothetical protein
MFPVYTPAECTDCVAPVDHHVGARLKKLMSDYYHIALETNYESWSNPPSQGGLEAWERRVCMATWLATAWKTLKHEADFLKSSFTSTRFLLALKTILSKFRSGKLRLLELNNQSLSFLKQKNPLLYYVVLKFSV